MSLEIDTASKNLEDILKLRKNPEFQRYFLARVKTKVEQKRDEVLSGKLDKEALFVAVREYRALISIQEMMDEDERGARLVIREDRNNR